MVPNRIEHIRQALAAAESSIRLAKQLLNEIESGKGGGMHPSGGNHSSAGSRPNPSHNPVNDKPGIVGIYDGEKMVTTSGEVFPVPNNYASKSLLVIGDTLKMYEENGEKRFKQIEHVKRHKTQGLLVKKDGKYRVITPEGSYKVLQESIDHFKGEVGDEVILHLPAGNMTSPFGAVETIRKKKAAGTDSEAAEAPEVVVPVDEAKPAPKKEKKSAPKSERKVSKPAVTRPSEAVSQPVATDVGEAVVEPAPLETTTSGEDELS